MLFYFFLPGYFLVIRWSGSPVLIKQVFDILVSL